MNRILVIQTAFPGDCILTLPMIQKLWEDRERMQIEVLTSPRGKEIFEASPYVLKVHILDKKGEHGSLKETFRFARSLSNNNYTAVYSAHRSFRTGLIVLGLNVKESYGFENASLKFAYRYLAKYDPRAHEVKRNLDLIGNSSDFSKLKPLIHVKPESAEKVKKFVREHDISGETVVFLAPATIWKTKQYPEEYFAEIAGYLVKKGFRVALTGGPGDAVLCGKIAEMSGNSLINACGKFSIPETIELYKYGKALLCNDSAPAHMGMAADIPTLSIYCSTSPGFGFYPYRKNSGYISFDDLTCKPCGVHGYKKCPLGHFKCGYELKPEMVIRRLEEKFL